jgi:eukaryotic-like serine/threonine-protein kinase
VDTEDFQLVAEGAVIAGKFRLERILGVGGMGAVFEATHTALGERIAVKFLRPELRSKPELVERFLREARSQFRIKSDHIVRVLDVGTAESGTPYIAMELLEGISLHAHVRRVGRVGPAEAAEIVIQACDALAAAHALGIVHRDVKTKNLMLTSAPSGALRVKLVDFGVAQVSSPDLAERLTATETIMGTALYMPPEQLRSARHADARSDIWAIGVVLYEVLTGRLPYLAESAADMLFRHYHETPPPVHELVPSVPPELGAIVSKCLALEPGERFPSAAALAAALAPFASDQTLLAPRTTLVSAVPDPPLTDATMDLTDTDLASESLAPVSPHRRSSAPPPMQPAPRDGRTLLATVVLAIAVVGVAATFGVLRPTKRAQAVTDDRTTVTSASVPVVTRPDVLPAPEPAASSSASAAPAASASSSARPAPPSAPPPRWRTRRAGPPIPVPIPIPVPVGSSSSVYDRL